MKGNRKRSLRWKRIRTCSKLYTVYIVVDGFELIYVERNVIGAITWTEGGCREKCTSVFKAAAHSKRSNQGKVSVLSGGKRILKRENRLFKQGIPEIIFRYQTSCLFPCTHCTYLITCFFRDGCFSSAHQHGGL
jgi:hypothetical protein